MIDLHSHLLPDVDDGVEVFDESIEIIRELARHGIKKIVLTPHYVPETIYNSPRSDNLKLLHELKKSMQDESLDLELFLGNEIYINGDISSLVKDKIISPLGNGKYLLIELPMSGIYEGYEDIFYNLQIEGFSIILAHPERYISMQKDFSILERLHNLGILFQCNLGSIVEQYGHKAKKTVKKLAKKDMIFAFGTDVHHFRDFSDIDKAIALLTKIYGKAKLDKLLVDNPLKVLK
ncbi:hypothetical protein IKG06_03745 [Candidatus Saccharibacteria bacterium]|nr:hypothetical protein [Candidatus Saccharibacteria bacterium]